MSDPKYIDIGRPETKLIEECGELLQALSKAERFGWFNHHPEKPEITNLEQVKREMDDVVEACERLEKHMRQLSADYYK